MTPTQRVYAEFVRAAEAGERCPTNPEICALVDAKSVSVGAKLVAMIERQGLITVRRFSNGREVTIMATGKSTAPHTGRRSAHWRVAGKRASGPRYNKPYVRVADRAQTVEALAPPRIDRTPCFRCNTRADIGCEHNPSPASVTPDARHLGVGPKNPATPPTPVSSHTAQHGEVSV